ncbi:MAG: hypothetical protein ABIN80_13605 [Dyadobacter sp.]|uniref:hypothetical protein n=1 Tax=Dyadobacter sp. TaxID=1914288 RepID=UPI003263ABEC
MKGTFYVICFLSLCFSVAAICQPRVSNVRFDLNSKSKSIEIKYDVSEIKDADSVYIQVNAVRRGAITPRSMTGDFGKNIRSGKNKKIVWDFFADSLKINDDLVIKVNVLLAPLPMIAAADSVRRKPPIVKKEKVSRGINGIALVTLGAGLAAGGGMYYLSTVQKKQSAEAYEDYKQRNWNHKSDITLIGNDPYLKNLADAALDQAKSDYNKAKRQQTVSKALLFGGIAIVIADAVFTIPMLKNRKNKRVGLYLDVDPGMVASAGFQVKF